MAVAGQSFRADDGVIGDIRAGADLREDETMTTTTAPVVVGVAASTMDDDVLRFAVDAAERRGVPILLVHAYNPDYHAASPVIPENDRREVANQLLAETFDRFSKIAGDRVEILTLLAEGGTVGVLLRASSDASLLVLRRRDISALGRVFTGSIISGVAARAACPVAMVPAGWHAGEARGRIVVGIDETAISAEALDLGFDLAHVRGARLTVLHAWRAPTFYDDVIFARTSEQSWREAARLRLEETVAPWVQRHGDVTVDVVVEYERPATALARASAESDVLVVGRRTRPLPRGVALGSVTGALIRTTACPLVVAPLAGDAEPTAAEGTS